MSVMIKGAVVMEPSLLLDIIPLAWELLLNPLEELVSTAGVCTSFYLPLLDTYINYKNKFN